VLRAPSPTTPGEDLDGDGTRAHHFPGNWRDGDGARRCPLGWLTDRLTNHRPTDRPDYQLTGRLIGYM